MNGVALPVASSIVSLLNHIINHPVFYINFIWNRFVRNNQQHLISDTTSREPHKQMNNKKTLSITK